MNEPTVTEGRRPRLLDRRRDRLLVRFTAEHLGADAALLLTREDPASPPRVRAVWRIEDGDHPDISGEEGFIGRALGAADPIFEPLDEKDGPLDQTEDGEELSHVLGMRVHAASGIEGALCLGFTCDPTAAAPRLLADATSHAGLAALFLDNPSLIESLLRDAREDALTGCLRADVLGPLLVREVERCKRHGGPLSCCFIDFDHFTRVTDTKGHLAGNEVLAVAAAAMRERLRASDALVRFGGDEFVAVLPNTTGAAANHLARLLRQRIGRATYDATGLSVCATIGIAEWEPGVDAEALLRRADRALTDLRAAAAKRPLR
jgi:diguanylate cyclase (GGDEF)-like protein